MPFPNPATQFKGGERRGQPWTPIGKRRAKKLNREAVVYAAAFGPEPEPPIGSLGEWLRDVVAGRIKPDATQLYAAQILQRMGDDALLGDKARTIVNLDNLSVAERALLAKLMGKVLPKDNTMGPVIEAPMLSAPDERKQLLAELAKYEPPEEIERLRNGRSG